MSQPRTIRFGKFEIDVSNRKLRKRGSAIRLQPKQFAVLLMLAERAGQIVSRDEIRERIWDANTFVDFERSINFAINQIRAALGDNAEKPRFIETIPRLGYRFIYPVDAFKEPLGRVERNCQLDVAESVPSVTAVVSQGASIGSTVVVEADEPGAAEKKTEQPLRTRWTARRWVLSGVGVAMLLILTTSLLGYRFSNHRGLGIRLPWLVKAGGTPRSARTIALTNFRGVVHQPVFSPDGRQIAFLWNGKDQHKMDVYIQMIGREQPLRLTYSGARYICCVGWSSDGQWISFARCDDGSGGIFTVPVLGGAERKLTDVTCMESDLGSPEWTLDGKSMLLGDRCTPEGPYGIMLFSFATGQKRCLTSPPSNNALDTS